MRSQAPYKETFGEKFRQNDEYLGYMLKAVINHGIDEGVFDDAGALTTGRQIAAEYVDAMLKEGG